MSTTQPIKNLSQIENLKQYFCQEKPNLRNYALICLGMNSALRISDLLELKWKHVYEFSEKRFLNHIVVTEGKTGKLTRVALNQSAVSALAFYLEALSLCEEKNCPPKQDSFLFPGKNGRGHLSRSQAFRIIKEAGQQLHFENDISCHSLRKTFGYHAWKTGAPPAVLMAIYNHSSYEITKRYLGIEQDDKDSIFLNTNL